MGAQSLYSGMPALLFARNLLQAGSPGVKSAERSRTLHLRDGELAYTVANLEEDVRVHLTMMSLTVVHLTMTVIVVGSDVT